MNGWRDFYKRVGQLWGHRGTYMDVYVEIYRKK